MYVMKEKNRYSECYDKVLYAGPNSARNIFTNSNRTRADPKSPARLTTLSWLHHLIIFCHYSPQWVVSVIPRQQMKLQLSLRLNVRCEFSEQGRYALWKGLSYILVHQGFRSTFLTTFDTNVQYWLEQISCDCAQINEWPLTQWFSELDVLFQISVLENSVRCTVRCYNTFAARAFLFHLNQHVGKSRFPMP